MVARVNVIAIADDEIKFFLCSLNLPLQINRLIVSTRVLVHSHLAHSWIGPRYWLLNDSYRIQNLLICSESRICLHHNLLLLLNSIPVRRSRLLSDHKLTWELALKAVVVAVHVAVVI